MLFLIPVAVAAVGAGVTAKKIVDDRSVAKAIRVQTDEFCDNIRKQRITIEHEK